MNTTLYFTIKMPSHLELQFDFLWEYLYPDIDLETEWQAIPDRKFRFDYFHPQSKIAIEINGGIWMEKGGHSYGDNLISDYEKYNLAIANGIRLFILSSEMIDDSWLKLIAETIDKYSLKDS